MRGSYQLLTPVLWQLQVTQPSSAVDGVELRGDLAVEEGVLAGGEQVAVAVSPMPLDARPVHEEGVVEHVKFVVQHAHHVHLRHLV